MRKVNEIFINGICLEKILKDHEKWLIDNREGKRLELKNTDLSYIDLRGANLRGANLSDTDLSSANLWDADLIGADLSNSDLRNTDLSDAYLRNVRLNCANLSDANLGGADLRFTDLSSANLKNADLRFTNLNNVNFKGADLRGVDLRGANLRDADLRGTNLNKVSYNHQTSFFAIQCPEKGSFIGYKKADNKIVELLITEDSERSSATTRKCRCSKAKVLSITNIENTEEFNEVASDYDKSFIYRVGEIVEVKDFNNDRWDECSTGIHFFIIRNEAVMYLN